MGPGRSFLDLVAFWQDLEEVLGRRVDVITNGGVSQYLRDRIYAEAARRTGPMILWRQMRRDFPSLLGYNF
jgi:hypothetical protein